MKSLRRLPEGTDPRGLRSPFVVAAVERPKTYGLGILGLRARGKHVPLVHSRAVDQWPPGWAEIFGDDVAAALRAPSGSGEQSRAGKRRHRVPAEEVEAFLAVLRRAEAGRSRRNPDPDLDRILASSRPVPVPRDPNP